MKPDYISGFSDVIDNPVYVKKDGRIPTPVFSTGVGLIIYAINNSKSVSTHTKKRNKRNNKENSEFIF